jgi:hypothetical protein
MTFNLPPMYKATFDIVPETCDVEEVRNSCLLIEVGEKVFSYLFYNKEQQHFLGLRQYSIDNSPGKTMLESLLEIIAADEMLQMNFKQAFVIYNYSDSSLLPSRLFHIELNQPATEMIYGNARKGLLLSEKVSGWDMYNIYRVPREIHALLQQKFAAGNYWHYNTLLLSDGQVHGDSESHVIKLIMGTDHFVLMVFKEKNLLLLQSYSYQTPDDVSYYLLSTCNRFQIVQEKTTLIVSGLLEEQSRLYQELLKYFLQVQWDRLPASIQLNKVFSQFPSHYFSPLLKMALCV